MMNRLGQNFRLNWWLGRKAGETVKTAFYSKENKKTHQMDG